jgi:hypothetical protein
MSKTQKPQAITLSYNVPILESAQVDSDFVIQGVAINATITSNNHKFLNEELRESATTLTGVPLLVDHRNEISAIKGRVTIGEYDEVNSRINFKAKVVDKEVRQMIRDKLINSVSVGATVKDIEEGADGVIIPRGICFKELSLVAVPADGGATFTTALHEAYTHAKEWDPKPSKEEDEDEDDTNDEEEEIEIEDKAKIEVKELQSPTKVDDLESMKGGLKMSEEITKVEQKLEVESAESKMLKEMMSKVEAMSKELTELKAKKEEIKAEVKEEEAPSKYNIVQGFGSLRGSSYTLVR